MDPKLKVKIDKRQEANRELLRAVGAMVDAHPELRFHQILHNMDVTQTTMIGDEPNRIMVGKDLFYEESVDTLNRVNNQHERQ